MLNWVHCHKCSALIQKNKDLKYYLTECGHIFCEKCSEKDTSSTCIICKNKSGIIQLSKEMDPNIRLFFSPVENQLKKCLEISNFQNYNKESLISSFQQKYEYAKQQYVKEVSISSKLMQENKMLRAMLRHSAGRNKPPTSTPTNYNNASFQNVSASTISPVKMFNFGSATKLASTPMRAYPGVAQKLCTSRLSNQSSNSQYISPAQVVPKVVGSKLLAPIHRSNLGTMSSMQDLLRKSKSMKI